MHSSSNHLLRILDTKQIGTKHTFLGTECYVLHVRAYHHACIHHCHATSACRLCIDYIQQQCVRVFVPFILATSPSDEGDTCHFAVYLEDYTLGHGIKGNNKPERPPDHGHNITNHGEHTAPRAPDDTYGITQVGIHQ